MVRKKRSLVSLREEKAKLMVLAKRQRKVRMIRERAVRQEKVLRREIAMLKAQTSKSLSRRIIKTAKSPKTKAILKKAKSSFIKFAESLEKADI